MIGGEAFVKIALNHFSLKFRAENCPENVRKMSGKCSESPEHFQKMSGKYVENHGKLFFLARWCVPQALEDFDFLILFLIFQ